MSQQIDQFLKGQNLPGVIALGTTATDTIYEGAFGVTNVDTGDVMTMDTPHAIFSMTKPITSFAIMQLVESGQIDLDAPAARYRPQYADLTVLDKVDLENRSYSTVPLRQDFTIRQLLTHTAGLGYTFCNDTLFALRPESDQADFPLVHQPGEIWTYSLATRLLGDIITEVTGKDLGTALKEMIFDPLRMGDTNFEVRDSQAWPHNPTVASSDPSSEKAWTPARLFPGMPFGDGGLISTARDYAKFVRCLLQKGKPLLTEATFQAMVTNQIGDLTILTQPDANKAWTHPFPRGAGIDKWGLGFQIHMKTEPGMRSRGSYSWCGLLNTYFWGDPVKQVGGVVLMQILPLYEPVCLETVDGFERRFYELVG